MQEYHVAVLWRRLDISGAEYGALWAVDDGWELRGTACVALDGQPVQARYTVRCNNRWETTAVQVIQEVGTAHREEHLTVDDARRWWRGGAELSTLHGCVDVDLGITPATNTLAIRRTALAVGDSADLRVAWMRFPDLSIQVMSQRYVRLLERRYRYESPGFTAELEVDVHGLVVSYEGGWERVATSEAADVGIEGA